MVEIQKFYFNRKVEIKLLCYLSSFQIYYGA